MEEFGIFPHNDFFIDNKSKNITSKCRFHFREIHRNLAPNMLSGREIDKTLVSEATKQALEEKFRLVTERRLAILERKKEMQRILREKEEKEITIYENLFKERYRNLNTLENGETLEVYAVGLSVGQYGEFYIISNKGTFSASALEKKILKEKLLLEIPKIEKFGRTFWFFGLGVPIYTLEILEKVWTQNRNQMARVKMKTLQISSGDCGTTTAAGNTGGFGKG